MKWYDGIWLKKLVEKGKSGIDRDIITFSFFLLLSFVFWYLNSLQKDVDYNIKYPVKYVNLPEQRVLADELPSKLDLYLKGPGYSIVKLKLAGNRAPVILDVSTINYRRVPGSRTLSYYVITSGLIPKLKNQLRAECDITSIRPDTLFFTFDRIITKQVRIEPDLEIAAEKQYFVKGNIIVDPDTVEITGPKRVLDTIKTIRTKYKKIKGISQPLTRSFALVASKDYSMSVKKTTLTIPVEQFTEAEISVPVKIVNSPDSINIRIFPDVVSVKFLVAVSDYKKIQEIPFEVVLDISKADLNSSEKLQVVVSYAPPFVSSVRVTPDRIDFLIEKNHNEKITAQDP